MPGATDVQAARADTSSVRRRVVRLTQLACCVLLLVIAGLGLLGGLTGQRFLDSPTLRHIPMAPSTAMLFLVLGALLLLHMLSRLGPSAARHGGTVCLLVAVGALLNGAYALLGQGPGPLDLPFLELTRWAGSPFVLMSPATATLFALSGAASCLLLLRGGGLQGPLFRLAGLLGAAVAVGGAVFLLGYAFGAPLLYSSGVVPMARSTALAFALLGVVLLCGAGPELLPLRLFAGSSPQASLMRAFVPLVALLSLAHSLFSGPGWSDFGEGNALLAATLAVGNAVAVAVAVMLVARRVGGSLARAEALRAEAERRTNQALDEKIVMLKELHHRVKNNMQIVSSLCLLQAEFVADPRDRVLFEETQARIRSMALVHEDLYQSDDLSFVDMGSYVPRLVGQLVAGASPPVRTGYSVQDVRLPITQSVPCGMLLNELAMNALKHAFPGVAAPELRVALRREGGDVILEVADNGPGLPPDFRPGESASFGMVLVASLTEQLHGTFAAQRGEGGGASFVVRFPLNEA